MSQLFKRLISKFLLVHLLTFAYIQSFHFIYVYYLSETFYYYKYLEFSKFSLYITYLFAWLPVIAARQSNEPAQVVAGLIFVLLYVPIQLSLLFSVNLNYSVIFVGQTTLAFSMVLLFIAAKGKLSHVPSNPIRLKHIDLLILSITFCSLVLMIIVNFNHMRLTSFENVYDVRFEARDQPGRSIIGDYLDSWVIYCFIPYFYARGILHRKWFLLIFGFSSSVLVYMAQGHKSVILLLALSLGLFWVLGNGKNFLNRVLFILIALSIGMVLLISDEGLGFWIKSIFFQRMIGTGGWVASRYFEYFAVEPVTYYSHIGVINKLTSHYPFDKYSLGQMIGLAYSNSSDANHNASFWASDGFAAIGPFGVIVVTPFVMVILKIINKLATYYETKFVIIWMSGFIIALLNVPLTVALLSCGGIIIFGLTWMFRNSSRRLQV